MDIYLGRGIGDINVCVRASMHVCVCVSVCVCVYVSMFVLIKSIK